MPKRDFRRILDFSTDEVRHVLELARDLKREVATKRFTPRLKDRVLAMLFEKPSLRTRCTFEIAMIQMGGTAIYLGPSEIGIGKRESVYDIAKNLERWFDLVMIRTFAQKNVDELAQHCSLPVINALSDFSHPCQVMADFLTVLEKRGSFDGFKLAYLGDGNNVCHSLLAMTARLGTELRIASPKAYAPQTQWLDEIRDEAKRTGARIVVTEDPAEAVRDVEAIYTDVWASMGKEAEAQARRSVFEPYQLNAALARGARPDAWIMHDLPAHRGEEITDEMMDSPRSIVFDQAENRLHAQKAIMVFLDERRA
ncbi:ornithine carbamoyltransferase [Candidatus Sumerlaeota bacterium]|nr:ornithine carbamoyltransferase [Candidatus Sumerlaeota bacterium]